MTDMGIFEFPLLQQVKPRIRAVATVRHELLTSVEEPWGNLDQFMAPESRNTESDRLPTCIKSMDA